MFIDTRKIENMERDILNILGLEKEEFYEHIVNCARDARENNCFFDLDIFYEEIDNLVQNLIEDNSLPDEVLFFHLGRRLKKSDDRTGRNLMNLLTNDNAFCTFLQRHYIEFQQIEGHLSLKYHGKEVPLEDTTERDVCYLRSRLGYNKQQDFCLNGFLLFDRLMHNNYARELYEGPEFLQVLSRYLNQPSILTDYFAESEYMCYVYKLPLEKILFDDDEHMPDWKKSYYLLNTVIERLLENYENPKARFDERNPVLRLEDRDIASEETIIETTTITCEMLY